MTDFSGTYTSTINIGSAQSPATVTATGRVNVNDYSEAVGVQGSGMLTNLGAINANADYGNGQALGVTFTGTVINGALGNNAPSIVASANYRIDYWQPSLFNTATAINISGSLLNYALIEADSGNATGVNLDANSTLVNSQAGQIVAFGYYTGVQAIHVTGAGSTATNLGTVRATGGYYSDRSGGPGAEVAGIILDDGGVVNNGGAGYTSAIITTSQMNGNATGVDVQSGLGTITNFGTITVSAKYGSLMAYGVRLAGGGGVTNGSIADNKALIETQVYKPGLQIAGPSVGIDISGGAGTVTNYGTITASGNGVVYGLRLAEGGIITNGHVGDTSARIGAIDLTGTGNTIVNYGVLGPVIGQVNRLVVEPGAVFTGVIQGASDSVLEFTSGSNPGDLSHFSGFTTVVFDPGSEPVSAGPHQTITVSGTISHSVVLSGGTEIVVAGGEAVDTLVEAGGMLRVSSGGVAVSTTVSGGGSVSAVGREIITNGGTASASVLSDGGAEVVSSGGTDLGANVHSGGALHISNGGTASDAVVFLGGELSVYSGGSAQSIFVRGGGELLVSKGGVATEATISGTGAREIISSSGVASGTLILSGSATVSSGGVASSTTIDSRSQIVVSTAGIAISTRVGIGGEAVLRRGTASTVLVDGGELVVSRGGIATHATISSDPGANSASRLFVSSGGVVSGGTVGNLGEAIIDGGSAKAITITHGGTLTVSHEGIVEAITVTSSGMATVGDGGVADRVAVTDFGLLYVSNGGLASGTKIAGGRVRALAGSTMLFTSVGADGGFDVFHGSADETRVSNGGLMLVSGGGVATLTRVFAGGLLTVLSLGKTVDTRLSGGEEIVSKGGRAISALVSNGGLQLVRSGGTVSGTGVHSGGELFVSSGGFTTSLTVSSGGKAEIGFHGLAKNPTIAGGTFVLDAFYSLSGSVDFADHSGGSLVISSTLLPNNLISGFVAGDTVDLAAIKFSTSGNVSLGAGNVLIIRNNGHSYELDLDPNHNFGGDTFHIKDDGHGDTLVYETKNTNALVQAASSNPAHGVSQPSSAGLLGASGNSALSLPVSTGFG